MKILVSIYRGGDDFIIDVSLKQGCSNYGKELVKPGLM